MRLYLRFLLVTSLCLWGCFSPKHAQAAAKIRVITSVPELAEFTRAIAGELVDVESLATGVEDPHAIPMKPSFVPKLSRADIVVVLGLDNEHAYLPALIGASKNNRIQPGKPGYIDTSHSITPLELPESLSRADGDVHPSGNPHYNLDPVMGRLMVTTLCEGLIKNFPDHTAAFTAGRDAYLHKLDAKIAEWEQLALPLKGVKLISYHNHWPYFVKRYGLNYLGTIELRHGIEPTAHHITDTIALLKREQCKIIVREPQFSEKTPKTLANAVGAQVITLPIMVGGTPEAKTYIEMIEFNIRSLLKARP